jgi:ABC-2 type transport system permease protein
MTAFSAFLTKELRESRATWRLWVVPGILVFIGLTSPVMAAVTPALLHATAGRSPGVVLEVPDPVARDAYVQFLGNLMQLALLAIIATGGAAVAAEHRAGTAALMLTKPLTRAGFVVAKIVAGIVLLCAATVAGAALCVLVTVLLFDASHMAAFAASVGLWLALAAMFTALMVLLSAATLRQGPATGAGIAIYVVLFALTGFPLVRDHSPAGIMAASDALLKGRDVALVWPLLTTLVVTALCVVGAALTFRRKEL